MVTTKCEELIARDSKVIAPCSHLSYFPLVVAKGEGAIITDADGNQFIDFLSSASSLNLGSSNPVLVKAIEEQLAKFTQYTQAYTYNEQSISYAEKLASVYPGGVPVKVAFGNCGSDGNDAAVKFARAYTGRSKIITFINGYHGSTYGSITLTTCTTRMKKSMGPMLPDCYAFPFFGTDKSDEEVEKNCLAQMEEAFANYLPADEVAAVIIEPVQGDGGILPAHPIFMKKLYELCKKNGILFISEEVQQGFFRTGKMFAIEHYGIVPDGIILGKSVGASLTLGAFMGKTEIMDSLPAPAHLFTLGANSIACAAGNAAFDYYYTDEFQNILKTNIAIAEKRAKELTEKHPACCPMFRNLGFSMGIKVKDPEGKSNENATFKILYHCYEMGLLVISLAGDILRIQPPLNIKPEELEKGFDIIDQSMTDFEAGKISDEVLKYKAGW
ncbi:MAG: aminotransferase class III-fold pyridoxal phosphate-dependent enzyme [Clostridia bacterium]|nr:aminotransferase class III-fold pyridoxal phosphate-dependent enzyme [Clostridia bacterium]